MSARASNTVTDGSSAAERRYASSARSTSRSGTSLGELAGAGPEQGRGGGLAELFGLLGLLRELGEQLGVSSFAFEDRRERVDRRHVARSVRELVAKRRDPLGDVALELADDAGDVEPEEQAPLERRLERELSTPQLEQLVASFFLRVEAGEQRDRRAVVRSLFENASAERDGSRCVPEARGRELGRAKPKLSRLRLRNGRAAPRSSRSLAATAASFDSTGRVGRVPRSPRARDASGLRRPSPPRVLPSAQKRSRASARESGEKAPDRGRR